MDTHFFRIVYNFEGTAAHWLGERVRESNERKITRASEFGDPEFLLEFWKILIITKRKAHICIHRYTLYLFFCTCTHTAYYTWLYARV